MIDITLYSQARVPTKFGEFDILAFAKVDHEKMPHVALVSPMIDKSKPVLLRIHSECMTGDVFFSHKCDCGDQLEASLDLISKVGHQADQRDYSDAVSILKFLEINEVNLITNNPEKMDFLVSHEIKVNKRIPIVLEAHKESEDYFKTKKDRMGHIL